MTELDLLTIARSATANDVAWFSQMITITFAMVVAIYYFLNQAKIGLKIVAFTAYTVGMLVFLGEMLIESNVKGQALAALEALPQKSLPTQQLLGVTGSWLGMGTALVFNGSFWILWLGMFYLLFFWRKGPKQ